MAITKVSKIHGYNTHKILPLVYDESLSYYESLCKVTQKINEVVDSIDGLSVDILDQANAYTDNAIANQQTAIDEKVAELQNLISSTVNVFNEQINALQTQYSQFTANVNSQLTVFRNLIDNLDTKIDVSVAGVNARTDIAIEQMHDRIFTEISDDLLGNLLVTNFFTGARVTVQEMFNYLANLHVEDGITYEDLADREISYNELASLNISYTDLILHGNTLIQ